MALPGPEQPAQPVRSPVFYIAVAMAVGCGAMLVLIAVMAAVLMPVIMQAREKARSTTCLSNLKIQGLALAMYTQDYDETLPRAKRWMDDLLPYIKDARVFRCPSARRAGVEAYGYAYNSGVAAKRLADLGDPASTRAIYDSSNLARNAADRLTSLPRPGRHLVVHAARGNNFVFLNGRAAGIAD